MTESQALATEAPSRTVAYTVRVYVSDDQVPFMAEVDEHPELAAFGRDVGELFENVAKGIEHLD